MSRISPRAVAAGRALAAGLAVFLLVAPLLAVARQAALLVVAALVAATADLVESRLLPLLPVDPVYGGAGLRVLGGIEPRGLAVAGPPGLLLHQLVPAFFFPPELTATGAAVSALVDPGITVLARVLTALLATSVLVALASAASRRARRPALVVAARLAQIWLLIDLAHEADLSVRDLEATGLPFALAAFAPVDANGQRVLLTTYLDGLPGVAVGVVNAALAVIGCLLAAAVLRLAFGLTVWLVRHRRLPRWSATVRALRPVRLERWRFARLGRHTLTAMAHLPPRAPGFWRFPVRTGLANVAALVLVAVVLSVSPFRSLAEGETAVLIGPASALDDETTPDLAPASAADADSSEAEAVGPAPADDSAMAGGADGEGGSPTLAEPAMTADALAAAQAANPDAHAAADAHPATVSASAVPEPALAAPSRGSVVAVEGSGYQYTLRVDGEPTIVRGMGYNPWYAELPVEQRQELYRRDFSAMREIGVNTLEGWFQQQFDEVTLDEAHRQGLKVIVPFELNHDYDYSDPAVKAMFREQVTAWVLRYREHPAVLMWGPGNEVMHRLIFPTAVQGQRDPAREQRADDFAAFYVELIDMVRQIDPHHPVLYRDAEDLYFSRMRQALLKDGTSRPWFVYGTNVYTERLAEVIERWPMQGVDAPLLISEFSPGGVGAAERPDMLGWYWSTIRAHPKRVIGGVVYTWATRGPEDLDRVFGLTDESGVPVDGSTAALRRLFQEDVVGRRDPP